jgi:CubicO group peptidase (beta-lactamase class C family)
MRHGAFSVTKSIGAAVALLRLAQKYGAGVMDEQIGDHVAVTAAHGGWTGVTFRHALDMAVGVGDRSPSFESNDTFADENQLKMDGILANESTAGKLQTAFSYDDYPWGPGVKVRYNSTHTFVLAAAMDAYLKSREGPGASIDQMLRDEVYRPIGIRHFPLTMTIEPDGSHGLPLLLIGSYPTLDEIARIAELLQNEGRHEGVDLLHPELTAAALYRRNEIGLPAHFWTNPLEPTRYQMSFWSWASEEPGGCVARTPTMSGFGGNIVALLANGATAIRFADGDFYSAEPMVETARQLGPLCQ